MYRPRLIRGLRIAWSVWWGILCVLLIGLWLRSYRNWDIVSRLDNSRWLTNIGSNNGYVHLEHEQVIFPPGAGNRSAIAEWQFLRSDVYNMPAIYYWHSTAGTTSIRVPYRYVVPIVLVTFAAFAIIPWVPLKFSVRTLLIATTLVAVLLGLVAITPH